MTKWIRDLIFFGPLRRPILLARSRFEKILPERVNDWVLDQLYPDDCIVTFNSEDAA